MKVTIILDSQEKSVFLHPPQYLLLPDFSAFAHVLGVRWNLLLVLICVSPVSANVKHPVTCVLAFCTLFQIICFGLLPTFYETVCLF